MNQPPKGLQARNPLGTPALTHISLAHFVGTLTHRFADGTALFASLLMTPKSAVHGGFPLLHSSLGCTNVLLNIKVKTRVLNWLLALSAVRNITDKDDGPSERAWTPAKSALEQERIALAR